MREQAINKADRELTKIAQKELDLITYASVLVLHRCEGWGRLRIERFEDIASQIFIECSNQDKSLVQMCDEEVGIEFQTADGHSWEDAPYLNAKKWNEMRPDFLKKPKAYQIAWLVQMKQKMSKWMKPQIMSSVALALYRKEKLSKPRIAQIVADIEYLIEKFNRDEKEMCKAVEAETGMRYTHTNCGELALLQREV